MKCCGYSVTQSPVRITAAVTTGFVAAAFAIKTGFVAYEIFSGCSDNAFYDFYSNTARCEQEITDAFVSGACTLIAAAATAILSLKKPSKAQTFLPQASMDALVAAVTPQSDGTKLRSLSVGATPRRLVVGTNGVVVVDPKNASANAALRADLKMVYPESAKK